MAALISRRGLTVVLAGALASGACAKPTTKSVSGAAVPGDDVTLYRDGALIRQQIELDLPATATTVKVMLATGVSADQIVLLDRGGVLVTGLHAMTSPGATVREEKAEAEPDPSRAPLADLEAPPTFDVEPPAAPELPAARKRAMPSELTLDVQAPRAGKYSLLIAYTTDKLRWDVAYTMTAAATRDHGELRGALAIRNETGIVIQTTSARVIDAELVAWRGKTAEHLAATLVGGTHSSTLPAAARELGRMRLGDGETRVDLLRESQRRMSSVLVYDPIGTRLDNPGAAPLRDLSLGMFPKPSTRVKESFEVARDTRGTQGLPAGPVRLLERKADGSFAVLGESRLFDAATRVSAADTIAIGTADGVTATRERREITLDEQARRLTEEFMITLDNKRAIPAEVIVREHLYRGQNWTLAYHSAPSASKDGPQQISLRTKVPPKSQTKILYVVVYTWGP